jgi:hypothetical protein
MLRYQGGGEKKKGKEEGNAGKELKAAAFISFPTLLPR